MGNNDYKPWKDYRDPHSVHNQPIHSGNSGHESQAIKKEKNGLLHLGRIDQHFAKLKKDREENKAVQHLNKEQKAKDSRDREAELERIDFDEKDLAQQKKDLKANRISVQEFRDMRKPAQVDTLPSGTIKGELSEHDKKRIHTIDNTINNFNTHIEKIKQEHKNPDSKYTKADQAGKEEMDKSLVDKEKEILKLTKERDELTGTQHRGFGGIGNQHGTENYKSQVIPTRERKNQESAYASDKTAQYGEKVPTFAGHFQKKRKVFNEFTGQYEWTEKLSDTKREKYARMGRQDNGEHLDDHDHVRDRGEQFIHEGEDKERGGAVQQSNQVENNDSYSGETSPSNLLLIGQGSRT
jgi:hypothetical protein